MTAVVTSEPRVYGPGSDASYVQDVALSCLPGAAGHWEARERLDRYAHELDVAIANPTTPEERAEGQRAVRLQREHRRTQAETRTGTSSTIAGFTTPAYLTADWAAYRSPARAFTDQATLLPLPEYGLQVNVPSFTSATSFGTQTEGSGASENDPSGVNIQATLTTQAGIIAISQQLFDRGGMTGLAFDRICLKQMKSQLDSAIDQYVLTQALANAGSTSDSTFSIANFLADIAKGRESLSDTAGTRLLATHLFTTSDLFGYVTRQVDATTNRPILTPDSGAIMLAQATGDPKWDSWTGVHLGQLRWHTDDNIPALSGNTQLVVARPEEVYVFDGDEFAFAYPETQAQNLSVIVGLRAYVGVVVRFAKAISAITGAAYPTTLV